MQFLPLREIPFKNQVFKKGDVFVLFGELFDCGYVNGLLEEAKKYGMRIFGITTGKRNQDQVLQALSSEELAQKEKKLGGEIINIPLEAGFGFEKINTISPIDVLDDIDLNKWKDVCLDKQYILACKEAGEKKFEKKIKQVMDILYKKIPANCNILFAHTMAGGVLYSSFMILLWDRIFHGNRIFSENEAKHQSSLEFWQSDIGHLCSENFNAVTADTFHYLIQYSHKIRSRNEVTGYKVFYSAYGYHGSEIFINCKLQWQTFIPYLQGHAKKKLEFYAKEAAASKIKTTVFNCPEICSKSSKGFKGGEIPLFLLLKAFQQIYPSHWSNEQFAICQNKLKSNVSLKKILEEIDSFFQTPNINNLYIFENWPIENNPEFSKSILDLSDRIASYHKSRKDKIGDYLTQHILKATGHLIFDYLSISSYPVIWIGHDIITKKLMQLYSSELK